MQISRDVSRVLSSEPNRINTTDYLIEFVDSTKSASVQKLESEEEKQRAAKDISDAKRLVWLNLLGVKSLRRLDEKPKTADPVTG